MIIYILYFARLMKWQPPRMIFLYLYDLTCRKLLDERFTCRTERDEMKCNSKSLYIANTQRLCDDFPCSNDD